MAAMSNYLENKLIDLIFRGGSLTTPATLYVALYTANPNAAGGGTEVAGGSYARTALAPSTANWAATNATGSTANPSAGTGGATSNNLAVAFPTPTAGWGTVTAFGIFDAATGGNLLFFATLTASVAISTGIVATFNPGSLVVTLS